MRMHRFIVDFALKSEKVRISDKNLIKQIKNVLRLKAGDLIKLSDGHGLEATGKIIRLQPAAVEVGLEKLERETDPIRSSVFLYCSILKKENFDLIVEKATEIGVTCITPLLAKNTVKTNLNFDRLAKISREASEQSGRSTVPEIEAITQFSQAAEKAKRKHNLNLFFDPGGSAAPHQIQSAPPNTSIGIFIGPEGGWSKTEINQAQEFNFSIVSLGKNILRAETAAIVAVFIARFLENDTA